MKTFDCEVSQFFRRLNNINQLVSSTMKPVKHFLIAATGVFFTGAVQADLCPLPTISPDLSLNIPCLDLKNEQLNLGVQLKYAFATELGMAPDTNLFWKLVQFEDSACYGKSANCATLGQNLDITFPLQLEEKRYTARLAYYPTPDQKGFYWRYVNHRINDLQFSPVKIPETDAEKRQILASDAVMINGKTHAIGFNTILRSGTQVGDHVFGQLVDNQGQPLVADDGTPVISNSNDFASLLPVGDKLFMVSHFESRPGAMYITELEQNKETGKLTAVSTQPADFSAVKGGWVHCAGSVTPWNSHLGSEEYEPDAEQRDSSTGSINDYYDAMAAYFGGDLLQMNPYDYGYMVEVKVLNEEGAHSVTKHYAMGRLAFELGYVLPDKKTAYMSDDGTNVGLYMFVADQEMDLDSGTLYVARWEQTSSENGGSANLSWIDLGHATGAEIKKYIDQRITFQDIFDKVEPTAPGQCPEGYSSINAGHSKDKYGNYHQCLKLKPGMEKAASRLETRRYAAMQGGTTELRKEEGITFNPVTNTLYVAISDIARGMEDNRKNGKENDEYDVGGPNHVRLPYNNCGGVYALDLVADEAIGSKYVAKNMYAIVTGNMTQALDENSAIPAYDANGPFANNKCDLESIASPDNVTFIPAYETLIIGEDTGSGHQNDMIWAYSLKAKALTRIQTTPYGSETTSPYIYADINGYGYLMSVVQHPFGESDAEKLTDAEEANAYTGYIGPFPSLK